MRKSVLFICVHNSARSQMAEALLKRRCSDDFVVESAGLEPGTLNPLAVEVMSEIGIDIATVRTKSVAEVIKSGARYSYVITVCDETSAERCPNFPGIAQRLHWSFADPSAFEGSLYQRLEKTRVVRDQIRDRIDAWCAEVCERVAATAGA